MAQRSRKTRGRSRIDASSAAGFAEGRFSALCASVGSSRLAVVLLLFAALAAVFLVRLVYLQVIVADHYSAMAEESRTISFTTNPRRGTIYDRNGVVLATSVEATTIYANPTEVTDARTTSERLAEILGGEASDFEAKLSQDATTFVYIQRQAKVEDADKVKELDLDGIYFIADTRREYPNGSIGGQVIGYCNVDGEGITGLELQYDDILKGTPGTYSAERGEGGIPIPGGVIEETPAVDGQDIMISLDIKLQDSVEQALAEGTEAYGTDEGCSVVMDAATGEIYAICSLPYMDPSNMAASEVGSDNLTAITQAFEPGSIFKTVSALAVLESGTMTPDDTLYCPSVITADGYNVSDAHERNDQVMSLRDILDNSSNVGISLATEKMGYDALHESIIRYNLTEATGVDYPGESSGSIQDFDTWARITAYNVAFGQGLTTTPLQMVRFYGAIANDGVEVTPHFLISKPQTGEWATYDTERVITDEKALSDITSMLRTVVENGTGKAADIEGYDVVGKTSTAQIAKNGSYADNLYNLCFTGFIANSSSDLVCFVSAKEVYGSGSVASIFNDIMTTAVEQYNIVPE